MQAFCRQVRNGVKIEKKKKKKKSYFINILSTSHFISLQTLLSARDTDIYKSTDFLLYPSSSYIQFNIIVRVILCLLYILGFFSMCRAGLS